MEHELNELHGLHEGLLVNLLAWVTAWSWAFFYGFAV